MTTLRALPTLTIVGLSAALLFGCGEQTQDTGSGDVKEEVGEAMEETREATQAAAEEVRETTSEAVEEAGDRIEAATD
jgi:hypothetical protein